MAHGFMLSNHASHYNMVAVSEVFTWYNWQFVGRGNGQEGSSPRPIKALGDGDILLVTRLDRLARSNRDLLNVLDTISKAGAKFRSLADAWADTTTPHGELMITILAGLATFERHLIKARTTEGRKRAQARGVRFGRPLKLSQFQISEALARREAGEPLTDIGRSYGVSHSTISRL
jgi:DNA invertase Pin-like site-specific DNA recombinase